MRYARVPASPPTVSSSSGPPTPSSPARALPRLPKLDLLAPASPSPAPHLARVRTLSTPLHIKRGVALATLRIGPLPYGAPVAHARALAIRAADNAAAPPPAAKGALGPKQGALPRRDNAAAAPPGAKGALVPTKAALPRRRVKRAIVPAEEPVHRPMTPPSSPIGRATTPAADVAVPEPVSVAPAPDVVRPVRTLGSNTAPTRASLPRRRRNAAGTTNTQPSSTTPPSKKAQVIAYTCMQDLGGGISVAFAPDGQDDAAVTPPGFTRVVRVVDSPGAPLIHESGALLTLSTTSIGSDARTAGGLRPAQLRAGAAFVAGADARVLVQTHGLQPGAALALAAVCRAADALLPPPTPAPARDAQVDGEHAWAAPDAGRAARWLRCVEDDEGVCGWWKGVLGEDEVAVVEGVLEGM